MIDPGSVRAVQESPPAPKPGETMRPTSCGTALVGTALFASLTGAFGMSPAWADDARAMPDVHMEAIVKAAQIDPRRPDDKRTPGAEAGVLLVERALRDRHLLDAKWVDG